MASGLYGVTTPRGSDACNANFGTMAGAVAQGAGVVVGASVTGSAGVKLELEAIGLAIRGEEEIATLRVRGRPGNRLSCGGRGGVAFARKVSERAAAKAFAIESDIGSRIRVHSLW